MLTGEFIPQKSIEKAVRSIEEEAARADRMAEISPDFADEWREKAEDLRLGARLLRFDYCVE